MEFRKILWKIEELWNKYYFIYHGELEEQFRVGIHIIKKLYKNGVSVHNSDFHLVDEFNFELSEKFIHSDEYGEYYGLKNSQVLEKDGKLVYLFDNHNKIIHPFLEYAEIREGGFEVVHIDAHDDAAVFPSGKPHHIELKKVQEYITQTRISDFFDFLAGIPFFHPCARENPVYYSGKSIEQFYKLIHNTYCYTKSTDFQNFKKPKKSYILSLDIDIFGPEGSFIDLESKIKTIAEAWYGAEVICIATSPGFIDQAYAQKIIEIFVK